MRRTNRSASFACCFLLGCSATGYSVEDLAAEINATRDVAHVVISVGDVVRVTFPFKPEWSHEARVKPDGSASFQLVDDVPVAGLSVAELDTRLTELYRAKRKAQDDVELTVDVPTSGGSTTVSEGVGAGDGRSVYVLGEVQRAGPVPAVGRTLTLIEAISFAGGHKKDSANLGNTILIRRVASTGQMRSWRLDLDIYSWGSQPSIFLQPRDIVFIPNTAIDEVNIWVDKYLRQMIPLPYLFAPQ